MLTSPYLTSAEAAAYLRYRSVRGFEYAVRKHGIPYIERDHVRLFLAKDLDGAWHRRTAHGWEPPQQTKGAA